MNIYIRYMVSRRCQLVVQAILDQLGLTHGVVGLGEVDIKVAITQAQRDELKRALVQVGLELMDDKKAILIEKIKNVIVQMVHDTDQLPKTKNSAYISQQLGYDYTYLSNIFSESTGITIEHFMIAHKVERIKELLLYDELNLSQIAYKLNYSSAAHLSNQFKKVTGLTPSFFKQLKHKKRIPLEDL